jgi:tRNA(Leu) C34 or U34 (ribose-2'-O)-methylase TrmL
LSSALKELSVTTATAGSVSKFMGKNAKPIGEAPAIIMCDPKFMRNVGMAQRLASAYGIKQVIWTGNRVRLEEGERLPREERMRGYKEITMIQNDYPFDLFGKGVTPVAIEVRENSEPLFDFEHPENAVYVFGPEDGSIPQTMLRHCHRFVVIPTRHCLNLATAISSVLYDREVKSYQRRVAAGEKITFTTPGEFEKRGAFPTDDDE